MAPTASSPVPDPPSVDVIVTAERGGPTLDATVRSVLGQGGARARCLLAGAPGGHATGIGEDLRGHEGLVTVEHDRPARPALRNAALARADADYLVFVEPGARLAPGGLGALVEAAERTGEHAAFGACVLGTGRGARRTIEPVPDLVGLVDLLHHRHFRPHCQAIRRELVDRRRFGASLAALDELDLWLRLGEHGVRWANAGVVVGELDPEGSGIEPATGAEAAASILTRAFRRAAAQGWETAGADVGEERERACVSRGVLRFATAAAVRDPEPRKALSTDMMRRFAGDPVIDAETAAVAALVGIQFDAGVPLTLDGRTDRAWAEPLSDWWRRCVAEEWAPKDLAPRAIEAMAELAVDADEVAERLLASCGKVGRLNIAGVGRRASRLATVAAAKGWRVRVLAETRVDPARTGLPAQARLEPVESATPGNHEPIVIADADETGWLRRYAGRPNVLRWSGASREVASRHRAAIEGAWPVRV